jgi:predicted outer membrane protein
MTKAVLASLLAAGLVFAAAPVLAQEQGHQGHHPAGASDSAKPQSEVPAAKPDQGKMHGGMMGKGGMMGGDCKMMEGMHAKMGGMMPKGDTGPSSQAYNGIMMRMHNDMAINYSGNADIDFVKGMIPHHQAAVDMAKTAIAFGKDPEVKKLAEDVIKAQEAEIAQMKTWLQKNGAQ